MSLKPVYHKANPGIRICYQTNRGWLLQQKTMPKGSRDSDCWHSESRPLPKAQAVEVMYRRYPLDTGDATAQAQAEALS